MAARIISRKSIVVSFEERRRKINLSDWTEREFRWRPWAIKKRMYGTPRKSIYCTDGSGRKHSRTRPDPTRNVDFCPQCNMWLYDHSARVVCLAPPDEEAARNYFRW